MEITDSVALRGRGDVQNEARDDSIEGRTSGQSLRRGLEIEARFGRGFFFFFRIFSEIYRNVVQFRLQQK